MKFACISRLAASLAETLGVESLTIQPELCPANMVGDLTINCFRLAGSLRKNPMQVAKLVGEGLAADPDVATVEVIKAFVNVTLAPGALFRDAIGSVLDLYEEALLPKDERRRYLVEFSAPNTNKPMHLGHVRNNSLGAAMTNILRRVGHQVFPVNLVNDRGIHICKSMLAYLRFGNGATPASTGMKGDHLVGDFYVKYGKALKAQVADLRLQRPELAAKDDDALFTETEIGAATQDMLVAWEKGDLQVRALWQMMNSWVLEGFAATYERMGIKFEHTYYESETYRAGKDMIRLGVDKGVFYKREDGATEIDLTDMKLDKKVVLRSDGTTVYITQDIATTMLKFEDYRPDGMVWVVGDEQRYHFQVLFAILKKLGYTWAENLHHLAYGMVYLPEGRIKSSEGKTVIADGLCSEVTELARQEILARCGEEVPADIDERARVVGLGAIKFLLLKVSAKTTMLFDPREAVKFEGDTGPYVQYAYARNASILRKAQEEDPDCVLATPDWRCLGHEHERALALHIAEYPTVLRKAATDMDTGCIASFLLDVAKEYHRFHHFCPVLKAESAALKVARLALCDAAGRVLHDGLKMLGIETLETM